MSGTDQPGALTPLPFSQIQHAIECFEAGVTASDLHHAALLGGLKNWPIIHRGRVEPHTNLFYVREWIAIKRHDHG